MHVHSDYSMCVYYFYSEHVSGACKNIHRLQLFVRQLTGPPTIPGLPLQELRLICPKMLMYLHFEKDKIISSTHWVSTRTILSYVHFGLIQAELLWIASEKIEGFFVALAFTQGPFTDITLGWIIPLLICIHIFSKCNRRVQTPTATEALQVKASRRDNGFLSFCLWTTKQWCVTHAEKCHSDQVCREGDALELCCNQGLCHLELGWSTCNSLTSHKSFSLICEPLRLTGKGTGLGSR